MPPELMVKQKKRILVVEDDPSVLKVTQLRLQHVGYEVILAVDGEEALQKAQDPFSPDLILLDIKLPKLDGFEVCARLRTDPSTAKIPVVVFTASSARWQKVLDRCVDLGISGKLRKPFTSEELLSEVRRVLQEAPLREETP